ncbi:MAG: hypothetical protein R3C18_06845 [Planctomycetaceae bacterium]
MIEESLTADETVLKGRTEKGKPCVIRFRGVKPFRELKAMKKAQHCDRHLPKVIDSGKGGTKGHYIVTTWAGGESVLGDLLPEIASKNLLPVSRVYGWMIGLASCLLKLHHTCTRIVHGDLKPANLAVSPDGKRLVPIDFGYSWSISETDRRSEEQLGTPYYSSPEQWNRERQVGPFSDQFSASVVFYRALTNQLPYDGLGGEALRLGEAYGKSVEYLPPSHFNSEVWPELDVVVGKGLSLHAEERYGTTRQWLSAIQAASRGTNTTGQIFGKLLHNVLKMIRDATFFLRQTK